MASHSRPQPKKSAGDSRGSACSLPGTHRCPASGRSRFALKTSASTRSSLATGGATACEVEGARDLAGAWLDLKRPGPVQSQKQFVVIRSQKRETSAFQLSLTTQVSIWVLPRATQLGPERDLSREKIKHLNEWPVPISLQTEQRASADVNPHGSRAACKDGETEEKRGLGKRRGSVCHRVSIKYLLLCKLLVRQGGSFILVCQVPLCAARSCNFPLWKQAPVSAGSALSCDFCVYL